MEIVRYHPWTKGKMACKLQNWLFVGATLGRTAGVTEEEKSGMPTLGRQGPKNAKAEVRMMTKSGALAQAGILRLAASVEDRHSTEYSWLWSCSL